MTRTTVRGRSNCPACGRREKRSTDANRRYWKLVSLVSANVKPDGRSFGVPAWHEQFKKEWLGCEDIYLPSGETLHRPYSSSDLEPNEFSEYMTKLEVWAAERGVYLDE